MFNFNKNSVLDSQGLSSAFRRRIIQSVTLSALALTPFNFADASDIAQRIDNNTSIFSQQIQNQMDQKESENSVFLVYHNITSPDDHAIIGSGIIIANSAKYNPNTLGVDKTDCHNRILTAFHVASIEGMINEKKELLKTQWQNHIDVYDSHGNKIANAYISASDHGEKLTGEISQDVVVDIATLKVVPIDSRYDSIEGAKMSQNPSKDIFPVSTHGKMGFSHGASGSGVYDSNGNVMGVLSFATFPMETNKDGDIHLHSSIQKAEDYEDEYHFKNFNDMNSSAFTLSMREQTAGFPVLKDNYVWCVPVSQSPNVMRDLNHAITPSFHSQEHIKSQPVQVWGYPLAIGVKYDIQHTSVVNPNDPSFSGSKETIGQLGQKQWSDYTKDFTKISY